MDIDKQLEINYLQTSAEAEACAQMMAGSEPWLTLRRDYATSLKILTDPTREVHVATVQGEIVGFILLNMRGAFVGYIQSICVAPQWRGQGVGSRLIAFAEQRIFKETPNVFICVSSFNPNARRLYERLGYKLVGVLKDYLISGYDEVLLRKTIAPLLEFKKIDQEQP
jgi:ribosomal protein S18 acetylase RimI-like enzyme